MTMADPRTIAAIFPDEQGAAAPRHRTARRAAVAAVALLVVASVVALMATDAFGSDASGYRTAVAATRDVAATLTAVGSIEPVSQAGVSFAVGGTVSTVDVALGDSVGAGQELASLDTTSLETTLHEKQAALARANLTLSKALNGESVGGAGSSGGRGASDVSTSSPVGIVDASFTPAAVGPRDGGGESDLAGARQAVVDAQQAVDAALAAADTALASAATACADDGASEVTACRAALQQVQTAQSAVADAQRKLATASSALDALLQQSGGSNGSNGSDGGTTPSTSPSQTPNGSNGSGSTTPRSSGPSSADLVAYQKAVDAAEAAVAAAEQSLAQASIVSPIAGTVVAVAIDPGATVTAGSSTSTITIQGSGGYEVTTNVSVDRVRDLKVGQPATVVPDGESTSLSGSIVAISVAPVSGSGSSSTYLVTVGLTEPNRKLNNGSTATVTLVTARSKSALTVPTSSVTTTGTRHTVEVLDGSEPKTVVVGIGVMGDTWTEIRSGLRAGRRVVLADVGKPLPSSATSSSNGQSRNGGFRLPGGVTFPGGGGPPVVQFNR
jgi:HlyD family secretion protein